MLSVHSVPAWLDLSIRRRLHQACFLVVLVAWPALGSRGAGNDPLGPRIDAIFRRWDKPSSPGLVLGVAQEGQPVLIRGYGLANLEHGIKMSAETVSESGSVAKQFTAAAVALLAVRGKLSLDDPVRKYLPEFPAFSAPITLRMLLNHTSGLRDVHGLLDLVGRPSYTTPHEARDILQLVSRQRDLNFVPGTEYLYSNTGFILLTLVVERVAGQPFEAFCAANVFQPHGMPTTTWRNPFNRIVPHRADGYEKTAGGEFEIDVPSSNLVGNGGVLSTAGEWLAWNDSLDHATGEWGQVVALLQTRSRLADGQVLDYGLGLGVTEYKGLEEISHGGSTSGYRTFLARFPGKKLSIALLGNSSDLNASELVHRVADLVLALPGRPEPTSVTLPVTALRADAGLYRNVQRDALLPFTLGSGQLHLGKIPLVATSDYAFVVRGSPTTYVFDPPVEGAAPRLTVTTEKTTTVYSRVALAHPAASELAGYVGDYASPELDVTVPISAENGKLTMQVHPRPANPAQPTFADGFIVPQLGSLTFTRAANGAVDGFEFTNDGGRCRRIRFERVLTPSGNAKPRT